MEEFTDDSPMPFGQYKGTKLANVPADHLLWLFRNERSGRITAYIKSNMDVLLKEANKKKK
jgi:uncharacterized protein (DUF3820 family)